jgi:hypothetical protein
LRAVKYLNLHYLSNLEEQKSKELTKLQEELVKSFKSYMKFNKEKVLQI